MVFREESLICVEWISFLDESNPMNEVTPTLACKIYFDVVQSDKTTKRVKDPKLSDIIEYIIQDSIASLGIVWWKQ